MSRAVRVPMRAKTQLDRQLRRVAQTRLEEAGPEVVNYVLGVVRSPDEATRDRLKASEMVLSRLLPALQAIDLRALVAAFGGDADTPETESKFSADKREAVRQLIAMARQHGAHRNGDGT